MLTQPPSSAAQRRDSLHEPDTVLRRWRYLPRLVGLLWSVGRGDVLLVVVLSVASGLGPLIALALLRGLVDSAIGTVQRTVPVEQTLFWLGGLVLANSVQGLVQLGLNRVIV